MLDSWDESFGRSPNATACEPQVLAVGNAISCEPQALAVGNAISCEPQALAVGNAISCETQALAVGSDNAIAIHLRPTASA